ncbi:MAG: hypothetical protein Q8K99_01785 [Actinomycetota bacterium]|nr:hypothetical protein [Actinomycetota bacterium]
MQDETVQPEPARSTAATPESPRDPLRTDRRVLRWLGVAVLLALAVAVLVNWYALRDRPGQFAANPTRQVAVSDGLALNFDVDAAAVDLLPSSIISYETITRQPVPGRGNQAAEAIYVTLNMDIEIQVPISVYARVETYPSSAEAQSKLDERMAEFTVRPETLLVGVKTVEAGFRADEGAWAAGWTTGSSYVFVRSAFKDKIPATKRDFLHNLGLPAVEGIEKFQRTGEQGLSF